MWLYYHRADAASTNCSTNTLSSRCDLLANFIRQLIILLTQAEMAPPNIAVLFRNLHWIASKTVSSWHKFICTLVDSEICFKISVSMPEIMYTLFKRHGVRHSNSECLLDINISSDTKVVETDTSKQMLAGNLTQPEPGCRWHSILYYALLGFLEFYFDPACGRPKSQIQLCKFMYDIDLPCLKILKPSKI